jgi:hypothetical protein
MFQLGDTSFFIHATLDGWEVLHEEFGDVHSPAFEYRFCWCFSNLEDLFLQLPDLVSRKVRRRSEGIDADPKPLIVWLKQQRRELLPRIRQENKAYQDIVQRSLSCLLIPRAPWSMPLLDTDYVLARDARSGWEILQGKSRLGEPGPQTFVRHYGTLDGCFEKLPLLLAQYEKRRLKTPDTLAEAYGYLMARSGQCVRRLTRALSPVTKPGQQKEKPTRGEALPLSTRQTKR